MQQSKLFIKGMVCNRCVLIVSSEVQALGYTPEKVSLGEVNFDTTNQEINLTKVEEKLEQHGFQLLEDPKVKMIKEVKQLVAEVYSGEYDFPHTFRFYDVVRKYWNNYETVSDTFIAQEKMMLERYIIDYRINKVKEYLVYSSDTLADIAFKLNFNSVAHLSAQFKQITGLTPSFFKEIKKQKAALTNNQ